MKRLAAIFVFIASASLYAQKPGIQTASVKPHTGAGVITKSSGAPRPGLDTLLADLERVTAATRYDLGDLQVEKWRSGWPTLWLKSTAQKREAKQLTESLKSNLAHAMPGLIAETQDSKGSMSATFKLYKDLSAVVESVNSLERIASSYRKKEESSALHADCSALGHLRQDLASYIQLTADSLEPLDQTPRPGTVSYGTVLSASIKCARSKLSAR